MGDYNIDFLDEQERELLESVISPFGILVYSPESPTRITDHSQTHIDYIIQEQVTPANSFVFDTPYKSDHLALSYITEVINARKKAKFLSTFDKTNYDKKAFRNTVSTLPWYRIYQCRTVQAMLSMFITLLLFSLEKHAPLKKNFIKYKPKPTILGKPWFDDECKKALENRQTQFNLFRAKPSIDRWTAYKAAKHRLSNLIKTKQRTFSQDLASNLVTSKQKWNFINHIRRSKPTSVEISCLKNSFGDLIVDDNAIANHLNLVFSNLGEYFGDKIVCPKIILKEGNGDFSFHPISEKQCFDIFREIDPKKPMGPCALPPWVFIDTKDLIVPHLTFIFNECIKQSCFPTELKRAFVTPIYKKGDALDPTNYRQISITNTLSKVFEKILHQQITNYLDNKRKMSQNQFGFGKKFSTQDALLFFTETLRKESDSQNIVHAVFLDLSKAFDSISHKLLMKKLSTLNFSESALKLMGDFLNQRTQKVKVNGKQSDWIELARGVPQGTVLGPLMFNLYVNDLNDCIDSNSRLVQYADDCLIFSTGTESSKILVDLQKNIANIEKYFSTHQLNLNASKTEFITFSRKNDKRCTELQTVTIGKTHVNKVNACKYLGVTIDEHLSFGPQDKNVLQKMAMGIKTIDTIKKQVPTTTLIMLLQPLVLSHLSYPALLLPSVPTASFNSLERQLNWALKCVFFRSQQTCS